MQGNDNMNYTKAITTGLKEQHIDIELSNVPLTIHLHGDHTLNLCFLDYEDDEHIRVVETGPSGGEEVRIIPKENIVYIGVIYQTEELLEFLEGVDIRIKGYE